MNKGLPPNNYSGDFSERSILNHALTYFKSLTDVDYVQRIFSNVRDQRERDLIESIMISSGLFIYQKSGYHHSFKIKPEVFRIINTSSVDAFFKDIDSEHEGNKNQQNLNIEKLQLEVDNLRNQMFDYDITKRRAKNAAFWLVVVSVISVLSLILSLLQWKCNKPD